MTKYNLVFLHGWGKSKEDYFELKEQLMVDYDTTVVDLPGFGQEKLSGVFTLSDYVGFVRDLIVKKGLKNVVLVGHSFGGRVAIKLSVIWPELVSKLVLIDSGGIREKTLKTRLAAILPKLSIGRRVFGSADYLAASGNLRETLINMVNEDLLTILPKVKVPTLIIWGESDHTTPLWMGETMHEKIEGSKLVVMEGDHGIPYRKPKEVAKTIKDFI